jgi:hypothetical protein
MKERDFSGDKKILVDEFIQKEIKFIVGIEIEIEILEAADNRLTNEEKLTLWPDCGGCLDKEIKLMKTIKNNHMIRLEVLEELRDGKPDINTPENRTLIENSPELIVNKE